MDIYGYLSGIVAAMIGGEMLLMLLPGRALAQPPAVEQAQSSVVQLYAMGYYDDGTPVLGLPGCVMYAKATVFDLVLPRIAAGVRLKKEDFIEMGEGGLCLGCKPCRYPVCPFGK